MLRKYFCQYYHIFSQIPQYPLKRIEIFYAAVGKLERGKEKGKKGLGTRGWGLGAITRKREAFGAGRRSISLCEGKELKARVALEKRRTMCASSFVWLLPCYCSAFDWFQLSTFQLSPNPPAPHASRLTPHLTTPMRRRRLRWWHRWCMMMRRMPGIKRLRTFRRAGLPGASVSWAAGSFPSVPRFSPSLKRTWCR